MKGEKKMRHRITTLVYIFMLLGVSLPCVRANLQGFPRSVNMSFKIWKSSSSSSINGGIDNNNFNSRRISSHGFRLHGSHVTEDQKRVTPNGANPLHN
ncbi:hypothetical protein I3843_04G026200 [Carya illinoinensis]|uniref:Clavata3/ESR (CLE) gene family member n=1 Tax=Carya illinoinensis TaxID=32201 RepID=A0A922FA03_CARIL|nr:hypothetical protein I3842_04G027500 [Carya illinoinensis]KAG7981990.1 hypothetical protein I3843_04G026200 [Carya illinoinensis]